MREISNNRIISAEMVDGNGKVKCMVHPSSSQYGGIRSAINHVYILEIVQMTEIMKREISTFFAGMERTIITEKQMFGIKIPKRKIISLEAYEILARTLFERG